MGQAAALTPKESQPQEREPPRPARRAIPNYVWQTLIVLELLYLLYPTLLSLPGLDHLVPLPKSPTHGHCGSGARFPRADDPFRFIPCTATSLPPALDDPNPDKSWAKLFDPNPDHWNWGNRTGIYMCGYLDVPLDYTNKSDPRIARLAVTKFQVSGLSKHTDSLSGKKTERTIVVNPGGPGGSGTEYTWRAAEDITERLSGGRYDVLGWDPRGVNTSLPAVSCFPADADRDRWALATQKHRAAVDSPQMQLELMNAYNNATLRACWERQGDLGRFLSTAFVARDVEEIRKALGEDELTGFMVSYGTGIGQTYANMFPNSVGRLILDGTEYVRDHRLAGGFGWTALDNVTDAWHDGFLGECLKAGPEHCALAKGVAGKGFNTLAELDVWKALAQMLYELGHYNTTLAGQFLERQWEYDPTLPCTSASKKKPSSSEELTLMVVCSDSYDDTNPGLDWWNTQWDTMTNQSWIAGDSRFFVFACHHYTRYWPKPAEVYRGDLNHTLQNPVLLVAEVYDPATPLRNGRRLLGEMGVNARLIVHHGYGHSSGRDRSACTDARLKAYILNGTLPEDQETDCYADEKPYLYGVKDGEVDSLAAAAAASAFDPVASWREHLKEAQLFGLRV
ncbi:hypothetical protein PG991_000153 [Apiospora marii]|uniref:AB hydrolase-1 domain-containing protein n=1 Tax=Apiospora marii TaxID=335849 RepID=A0ABR1T1B3_9PEZI